MPDLDLRPAACSFCRTAGSKLVAGPGAFICDDCIRLGEKIVHGAKEPATSSRPDAELACSFCKRSQHDVRFMVAGQDAYICDGCIALCKRIAAGGAIEGPARLPPGPRMPATLQILLGGFAMRWFGDYCARRYGDAFTTWMPGLPFPFIHLRDPEAIRAVFDADGDQVRAENHPLDLVLGNNSLLLLQGQRHARDRRLLGAALHGDRMRRFYALMVDEADRALESWPLGRRFQIRPEMQKITLNVIMRAIFGVEDAAEIDELRRRLNALLDTAAGAIWMVPQLRTIGGRFSALARIQRARKRVDQMLTEMLKRRRTSDNPERPDVLTMLIEAGERGGGLTDDEIRDEMVTLLLAGHETTATALSWTVVRILEHPKVYARVKDELREALADGQSIGGKLDSLQYLDATIREALRLNPVIPDIGRKVMWPIRIGGWDLPIGAMVAPSIDLTHRNPAVWAKPEEFRPERFLERRPTPYEYFPFGGGIRRCIGMSFAMFEIKAILARLLARCELRIAPGYQPRMKRRAITMVPSKGAPVVMDRCRDA